MKESIQKITAWIKAHPWASAAIGIVIIVVGYFVVKSTGGNSEGESLGMEASPSEGESLSDPLAAFGSGASLADLGPSAAAMPAITSEPQETESVMDSFSDYGDEAFSMDTAYGYDPLYSSPATGGLISSPASSASVINNTTTDSPLKTVTLSKAALANRALAGRTTKKEKAKKAVTVKAAVPATTTTVSTTSTVKKAKPVAVTTTPTIAAVIKKVVKKTTNSLLKPVTVANKTTGKATLKKTKPPSPGPGYVWNGYMWYKPTITRNGGR